MRFTARLTAIISGRSISDQQFIYLPHTTGTCMSVTDTCMSMMICMSLTDMFVSPKFLAGMSTYKDVTSPVGSQLMCKILGYIQSGTRSMEI